MPIRTLLFALLVALAARTAGADGHTQAAQGAGLPLSGRIFTDVYVPTRDPGTAELQQASASLWLQADPRLGESSSARFSFVGDRIERSASVSPQFRSNVREAWIDFSRNGVEARIGRQIISWGKSDVINPTDVLSAKDHAFFNHDEEVRRQGATGLSVSYAPGAASGSPWTLTAVWVPVFAQSTLLIPATAMPAGVTLSGSPVTPRFTIGNSETALKASYLGSGVDASAMVFRGWNHTPELTVTSVSGLPPSVTATAGQAFHRISATGGDVAYTTGAYTVRLESAYVWTENDDGRNMLVIPSHWDGVAGVERPFFGDFRAQAQFVWRYFPKFSKPTDQGGANAVAAAVNAQAAQANALLLNYQDRVRPASTLRLSYSNDEKGIEAELFSWFNFTGGDYLLRPKFSYAWTDALKTTLGVDHFGGSTARPLGAMYAYDAFFIEAKYSF